MTGSLLGRALALALFAGLSGCAVQVPWVVDPPTYTTFNSMVRDQKKEYDHPLLGIYTYAFAAPGAATDMSQARPLHGDFKIAGVKRGAYVDLVALSGVRGAAGTDQGATYSVNMQGATLWSFPWSKDTPKDRKRFEGTWSGIIGGRSGKSVLEITDDGWIRITTTYDDRPGGAAAGGTVTGAQGSRTEVAFLRRAAL